MPRLKVQEQELHDARGHGGTFTGTIDPRTGVPDGHGTMIYTQETSFAGDWEQGHYVKGTLESAGNSTYTGDFFESRPHGFGTITYHKQGGNSYTGEWQRGQKHGQGEFAWPALNASYKGEFRNNHRHGLGCYQTPSLSYTGDFESGNYHGKGVLEMFLGNSDGTGDDKKEGDDRKGRPSKVVHQGLFQHGKPHGAGVEETLDSNGTVLSSRQGSWKHSVYQPPEYVEAVHDHAYGENALYRGLWDSKNDRPIVGTIVFQKHSSYARFDGHFNELGNFDGEGRLEYTNGDVYEGLFSKGQRHGLGMYNWKDGRVYKGGYSNNVREGYGTMLYSDTSRYEGEFCNNQRHGQGRFYFADGSMFVGEWKKSQYRHGRLVHTNGIIYEGEFEGSVAHGFGKETTASGTVSYEGQWREGDRAPAAETTTEHAVEGDSSTYIAE